MDFRLLRSKSVRKGGSRKKCLDQKMLRTQTVGSRTIGVSNAPIPTSKSAIPPCKLNSWTPSWVLILGGPGYPLRARFRRMRVRFALSAPRGARCAVRGARRAARGARRAARGAARGITIPKSRNRDFELAYVGAGSDRNKGTIYALGGPTEKCRHQESWSRAA